jgi:hypothetical protein
MMLSNNAIRSEAAARDGFCVFPDGHGHWCACKDDGMVAGTFFNRDAALRFARAESEYWSAWSALKSKTAS